MKEFLSLWRFGEVWGIFPGYVGKIIDDFFLPAENYPTHIQFELRNGWIISPSFGPQKPMEQMKVFNTQYMG